MDNSGARSFILGIDLGANSVGWALIALREGKPAGLIRAGVRVFDAGMEGNLESGKEASKNRARREARLHRRQLWRRARRLKKVFHLLQRFGLLPANGCWTPEKRQDFLNQLDNSVLASEWFREKKSTGEYPEPEQVLPYILRARSLYEPLEPHMFGRALYHLGQRRGFLSNRKETRKVNQDDEGVVKKGIGELQEAIDHSGAKTLGEFFARVPPAEKRVRGRWTARSMYVEEFNKIWEAQAKFNPELLTEERKQLLFRAMFYQRKLKFDPDVIGRCELEAGRRRAPAYLLASQRFRLLQRVNDLMVLPPGETERPLTPEDRAKLIGKLEMSRDLKFKQIRELLGLTKSYLFNLERGGEERLPGNRTAAQFFEVFGERWLHMTAEERNRAVEYVYAFEKPERLEQAGKRKWNLAGDAARKLSEITLEGDYLNHSREAMERLLPLLEAGTSYATAKKQLYPASLESQAPRDFLPPVFEFEKIGNPGVMRSLTELRKVVNAVIRDHGKPEEIHIELARELKKPKKAREEASKKNRENEKGRQAAAERIILEAGIPRPSRRDIRKYQLAEECGWKCPYTKGQISMRTLFSEPQFDIEHIIPFSRSLDDSFVNVTLCLNEENRKRKGDKTPHEAYSGERDRYEEILEQVKGFRGDRRTAAEKLRRFKMTTEEVEAQLNDFTARQLGDTAYASRRAANYLGLLYGGVVDAEGRPRVQATSGQVTAYLRNEWGLNGILRDGPTANGGSVKKSRDDHRHHAVDAVAIALTDARTVKMLADAAQRAPRERRRRFASVDGPWPDFVDSARREVQKIVVSHRVSKKVSGALHKETNYAPIDSHPGGAQGAKPLPRVRKALKDLTQGEAERIADDRVKLRVLEKLQSLGVTDPAKAFSNEANLPSLPNRNGAPIAIRSVRITEQVKTVMLGEGRAQRMVRPESNHHAEIFAEMDAKGGETKWGGEVVTMNEACKRLAKGKPIVEREHGPGTQFKYSIAAREVLECDDGNGKRSLFVVRSLSQEEKTGSIKVEMTRLEDARQKAEIKNGGAWITKSPNVLRQLNARKLRVGPLGEVSEAYD